MADNRLYDTVYAEGGGGSPEEIRAIASVFQNRINAQGLEKALNGSSAYRKKSKEYLKASQGQLNPYEQQVYNRNMQIINEAIKRPMPYWYMENVNAYGNPPWVSDTKSFNDIGRQRFYIRK